MPDRIDKVLLSPALRVDSQDYHHQTVRVMIKLTRFYDYMLMLASFMEMKHRRYEKLSKRKGNVEIRYRRIMYQALTSEEKQKALILFYKKMIMEHCHLQHTLETWREAILNSTFKPKPPFEGIKEREFDPKAESRRLLKTMDLTEKECSLPIDYEHLKGEMIQLGLLQHDSVMTRESCRLFFDSLSDKSAMLKLEIYNQSVSIKKSNTPDTLRRRSLLQDHTENPFQHGFHTPDAHFTRMEAIPEQKKLYDVRIAKNNDMRRSPPVLPDISQQLMKEMEKMATQVPVRESCEVTYSHNQDQNDKGNSIGIDRYQEYLEIKRKLQGRIKPAEKAEKDPANTPKVAYPSPDVTKRLYLVRELLKTVSESGMSSPGANDSKQLNIYIEWKKRNGKRKTEYQCYQVNPTKDEPAAKKVKAAPEQLPFLQSVAIQDYKIPKLDKKSTKPSLGIPKFSVKRRGADDDDDGHCYPKKARTC